MYLSQEDQVSYLANAIFVAQADGTASPKAAAALEEIRASIGAKKSTYDLARKRALSGAYSLTKIANFAAQVSNLADMLHVCAIRHIPIASGPTRCSSYSTKSRAN